MNTSRKKIIIVGAGPGGLTAGMILAHRGFDVEIFEKSPVVGGRNAELSVGDFKFDVGPTFLMMKFILDEMFLDAGTESGKYLVFKRLDPMYRLMFESYTMDIFEDPIKMKEEIKKHFPGQEDGLDDFLKKEAKRFEYIFPCLEKDYSSFKEFFNPIFLRALPYIPIGQSIFQYLGKYFDQEKLRLSFTFQAKYLGMSPWECPGFFIILPFIEHRFGIFHVEGGLSRISGAMSDVFKERGGMLRTGTPIRQIIVEDGCARGVILQDGREVRGDEVIINADFGYAMTKLMPPGSIKKYSPEKLMKKEYSCSTFMLYLGLDKTYDDMAHHSIVFANDYKANVDDIFGRLTLSDDFSFYIRNSSVNDDKVAPAGKSGIYVLVPVPNNRSGIDWQKEKNIMREKVLAKIETRTSMKDIRSHIVEERIITPENWENDVNTYAGTTFNLAHTLTQMLYFRPHNKFEEVDNCYLVGGGTHPGSGLPTIYQSGRIAANMISKKYGVSFTPPRHKDFFKMDQ